MVVKRGRLYERKLRLIENRILRGIFEYKWDESGEGRRLHGEELAGSYRSPNIIKFIKSRS